MKHHLLLILALCFTGCAFQWGHAPEPYGIPMGTHTQYEWEIVTPTGNSMEPYLHAGEPVIVARIPFEEIERGDVVLSWISEEEGIYGPFHRASQFKRGGDWIYTKGTGQGLDSHIIRKDNYIAIFAYPVADYDAWLAEEN